MNKKNTTPFIFLFIVLFFSISAQKQINNETSEPLIYFNFDGEKLIDIIDRLTAYQQINLLLPTDQKNLIETTVTFKIPHKIKVSDAWEMTITLLDIAGFATIKRNKNLYKIEPKVNISKSNAPFYVNVSTDILPNSNAVIRYLYYFQNIFLKEKGIKENFATILKDMLPLQNPEQNFTLDENYNSVLITAQSNVIKGIINLIRELDQSGFREAIEVIPIINTNAEEIVSIIDQLIPQKQDDDKFRFPPMVAEPSSERKTYFSSSTRIVTIPQTNSVAIFGLYDSVQRVKDFIRKYLDKKVDADKTVLHVKPLKYLKAEDFSQTLSNLIQKQSGQSAGENKERILSPDIIITAEKQQAATKGNKRQMSSEGSDAGVKLEGVKSDDGPIIGGNNLIIACNQKDWKILDELIDKLDHEQWQVAIEVLIVDMTLATSNRLGTQLRRMHNDTQLHNLKWQSAHIEQPSLDYTSNSATAIDTTAGIEADLNSQQYNKSPDYDIAKLAPAGSSIFTFKDNNGIAAILEILSSYTDTKILSQPFVIARNNEQANILQVEQRWYEGQLDNASAGGTPVINYEAMNAATAVTILPRISKPADNINLEIKVAANEFIAAGQTRNRTIETNANVGHNEVLVLGGISKTDIDTTIYKTPILSQIPILGFLFKNQIENRDIRNLMIFISPTRIPPTSVTGKLVTKNKFTQNKVDKYVKELINSDGITGCPNRCVKGNTECENFQCLKDPINNFMFYPKIGNDIALNVESYAKRGVWTPDFEENFKKKQTAGQETQKKKESIIPSKKSSDKLQKILKEEESPIKSKT
jgi:general secretion pathway protein D